MLCNSGFVADVMFSYNGPCVGVTLLQQSHCSVVHGLTLAAAACNFASCPIDSGGCDDCRRAVRAWSTRCSALLYHVAIETGAKYTVMSMSVCLSVCLCVSVCPLAYLENHVAELHKFSVHVDCTWLGPRLTALLYIMYFRFCG